MLNNIWFSIAKLNQTEIDDNFDFNLCKNDSWFSRLSELNPIILQDSINFKSEDSICLYLSDHKDLDTYHFDNLNSLKNFVKIQLPYSNPVILLNSDISPYVGSVDVEVYFSLENNLPIESKLFPYCNIVMRFIYPYYFYIFYNKERVDDLLAQIDKIFYQD